MEMKPDSRARKEPGPSTISSSLLDVERRGPPGPALQTQDIKTAQEPTARKPYFILSTFRHPKAISGLKGADQTSPRTKDPPGPKRPSEAPNDQSMATNNQNCLPGLTGPPQSFGSSKGFKLEHVPGRKAFCKGCHKEQVLPELEDRTSDGQVRRVSDRHPTTPHSQVSSNKDPQQCECAKASETLPSKPANLITPPLEKSKPDPREPRGEAHEEQLSAYGSKCQPEREGRAEQLKKQRGGNGEGDLLRPSQSICQNVKLVFTQAQGDARSPTNQQSVSRPSPKTLPVFLNPKSQKTERLPSSRSSSSSVDAHNRRKEDSSNGKSDEQLCRAFSVDRSLTMTAKVSSVHVSESLETDPEVERSMRYEENRTLSFLNEDDELLDKIQDQPKTTALRKNKLKLTSNRFLASKKYSVCENKELAPTAAPLLNVISNPSYPYYNSQLYVNLSANLSHNNEASMFSTQDSRPGQNKSMNYEPISEGKGLTGARPPAPMLRPFPGIPSYTGLYSEFDPRFIRDKVVAAPEYEQLPEAFNLGPYEMAQNLSMVSVPSGEDDLQKKTRARKCQPVTDSKEFGINVDRIPEVRKTTLMIKNIPNRYTKEMMLETIDKKFKDRYNFFYLPIDFDNNCNVGYAFLNFIDLSCIKDFYLEFNGKHWPNFKSDKICEITYARIQGKEACIQHFKDSSLMKQEVR